MIGKSTRRKHRRRNANPKWAAVFSKVRLVLVDDRCDFWVVTVPYGTSPGTAFNHHEIYGKQQALKFYRQVLSVLCPTLKRVLNRERFSGRSWTPLNLHLTITRRLHL